MNKMFEWVKMDFEKLFFAWSCELTLNENKLYLAIEKTFNDNLNVLMLLRSASRLRNSVLFIKYRSIVSTEWIVYPPHYGGVCEFWTYLLGDFVVVVVAVVVAAVVVGGVRDFASTSVLVVSRLIVAPLDAITWAALLTPFDWIPAELFPPFDKTVPDPVGAVVPIDERKFTLLDLFALFLFGAFDLFRLCCGITRRCAATELACKCCCACQGSLLEKICILL